MNELRCLRAIDRKDINLIKKLVSTGYNFNTGVGQRKMPPVIYYAVENNYTEAVEELLKAGCNVNVKYTAEQRSPLHVSAYIGNKDIALMLCESGANVNEINGNGETALFAAVEWTAFSKNTNIMQLLLSFGAQVNITSKSGLTPLLKAIEVESLPAIEVLVENGAHLNLYTYAELKYALKTNNNSIVKFLLVMYRKYEQKYNKVSSACLSPVDLCLQHYNLCAMKYALQLGFTATDKLFDNPMILVNTTVPNTHQYFAEAQYCFDYLLANFSHLINFAQQFAFKYEFSANTIIITGNLLTYALTYNCSHMSTRLIQLGINIERTCLKYYRFDHHDLHTLKLLYYCGHRFTNKFHTECYPYTLNVFDRKINSAEFKKFCTWLKTESHKPFTLEQQIRLMLRQNYGLKLLHILPQLNLPNCLVKYLCYEII